MRNQKVLQNNQINWFDEGSTRLNYQMIFNEVAEKEAATEEYEEQEDVTALLQERDERWKNKMKEVRDNALAEGLELGRSEGLEQARIEMKEKFSVIQKAIDAGHREWQKRNRILEPGLLDMVFEISEEILGIPVENPGIRKSIEEKLTPLLQKVDEQSRPILWVAQEDLQYIEKIKDDFSKSMVINIQPSPDCNPGEFRLETNEETVVQNFREMLTEFRKSLSLPSWK